MSIDTRDDGEGYLWPNANRLTTIHWNPLCSNMRWRNEARLVAMPVSEANGHGTIHMGPQGPKGPPLRTRLEICSRCLEFKPTETAWMREGACADPPAGPGFMWMPPATTELGSEQVGYGRRLVRESQRRAAQVCWYQCGVRAECEAFARNTGMQWGVWGGFVLKNQALRIKESA